MTIVVITQKADTTSCYNAVKSNAIDILRKTTDSIEDKSKIEPRYVPIKNKNKSMLAN